MDSISNYLTGDHDYCDDLFAAAETSVSADDWNAAGARLRAFGDAIERHFAMEEKILFLAFEKAIGSSEGPTSVMRMEHTQIRAILAQLNEAFDRRDASHFLGVSDTLNTMMQQHNIKEESILYLMTDRVLSGEREQIIAAMAALGDEDADAATLAARPAS